MSEQKPTQPALTLLQRAKQLVQPGNSTEMPSDEEIQEAELLIAWVFGEVSTTAAAQVLGKSNGNVQNRVGPALRNMAFAKCLVLRLKKPGEDGGKS